MSQRTETYTIGDTVKKTPAYTKAYPGWKIDEGTIVGIEMLTISDDKLSTMERGKYRERYTYQQWYPIFNMTIEYKDPETGQNHRLRVTQFDFNKD